MTKNKIKTSAEKTNSGITRGSLPMHSGDDFVSAQLSTSAASVAAMIRTGHFSKNNRTMLDTSYSNKTPWKWGDEILPSLDLRNKYANKKPQIVVGKIRLLNDHDDDNHDQLTSNNK